MDPRDCAAIVEELGAAFGDAQDVTPADGQPLHVLLPRLPIHPPWQPNPARGLARFTNWPNQRPDFWIEVAVHNGSRPPRNSSEQLVLGESWRQYSASVPWPSGPATATRAIQLWLNRFRDPT